MELTTFIAGFLCGPIHMRHVLLPAGSLPQKSILRTACSLRHHTVNHYQFLGVPAVKLSLSHPREPIILT